MTQAVTPSSLAPHSERDSAFISSLPLPGVMVVEDETVVARDIERTLVGLGYRITANVRTAREALDAMKAARPDIVLSDIRIKGDLDGIELATLTRDRFRVPVVFLSSYADEATLARAKAADPYGFVLKPFRVRELRVGLELALRRHTLDVHLEQQSLTDEPNALGSGRLTAWVPTATTVAQASNGAPVPSHTIAILKRALTLRQPALGEHAEEVAHYARVLAEHVGYTDDTAAGLAEAALLCDIGKLFAPDAVLVESPSAQQREQLKEHTKLGARLLDDHAAQNPEGALLQRAAAIALHHHERWDGAGYPDGLRDHEIPLDARVVAVANALAHMPPETRRDRPAVSRHFAALAGSEFDPLVVDALERALAELTGPPTQSQQATR